jgi:HSP20 family protein
MAIEVKPEETTAAAPAKRDEHALRRWDPAEMLAQMQEDMARFWSQAWPRTPLPLRRAFGTAQTPTPWAPRVDVYHQNGDLMVKAELPGIKKEDIEITLDAGDLVIRGERKEESEVKEGDYYRMERSYGTFYRRLPLPGEVKPEQVQASFADGVLTVRLPQVAAAQPETKKVPIT